MTRGVHLVGVWEGQVGWSKVLVFWKSDVDIWKMWGFLCKGRASGRVEESHLIKVVSYLEVWRGETRGKEPIRRGSRPHADPLVSGGNSKACVSSSVFQGQHIDTHVTLTEAVSLVPGSS